jgi:hypothetical protein
LQSMCWIMLCWEHCRKEGLQVLQRMMRLEGTWEDFWQ